MRKRLLVLGLMATSLFASAQRKCASFEHYQQQLARDPQMAPNQAAIERFTQAHPYVAGPNGTQRGTPVYNIPVVVHVLWNTSTQNISDAQIQTQIDVLNRDYQLNNSDTGLVPAAFKSFVADCKISFCMAQRDPSGNATTGIIRKQTTKTSFSADTDDAKSSTTGGDNAWDRNSYLNLWVVPAITSGGQGGILGYAQFPGGAAATDGVVIGYNYFGTTGTAAAPFNKGRTATHEVGHWLNLRHIWGDEAACAQDDLISDTPLQGAENYGCPTFPKVDACTGGNGVMYMNYMDYVDDACMYMFTAGQKSRMYGVLQAGGARASLASSLGCQAPSTTTCGVPTGLSASSVTSSSATVSWSAVSGASSYTVQYKTTAASTWTTAASAATGTSVTISGLTASTAYNWQVSTNCSASSSAFASGSFTTTAASPGCGTNYEPNESLAAAAAVATNTALSAAITTTTDQDWFKVTLSATSNFNISLTGLAGDYDLVLYNSAGTQLAISENGGTTSESITTASSAAGTYYVKVFGYNGANSATCYSLNIGATAVAVPTCPGTYDNSTNGTTTGAAQIPFNTDIKGTISSTTDVDYYKFVITTGGTITITLGTLPGDYDLKLFNSAGTQVGISQNGGTTGETISYTAAAGTYYAQVYGYNGANSATCYTLKVALGTATRQMDPSLVQGAVKLQAYPNPATTTLNINASGLTGRGQLRLIDASGRPVAQHSMLKPNASLGIQTLARGVYYVQLVDAEGVVVGQTRFVKQ
ncbi:T9SS type A sorting domain-containing protein [Flaviaesturariibacter flavus]|uniref:T9SS type A sorting domain-containing protein n=1 Tax=Flaviaesturariibacter flavus TaxID=2502780 RepID=A0A4R1BKP1_9BACT|nr:pre-peptidase C-terminal domain-containing protein [Flaviaesturariibacter flavus]TCJ17857.1 T9SS type A sorting domain-containing protein [Flaviaesturariibacter flavus]